MIKEVAFPSEGAILQGLLFLPEVQAHKPPVIIMAHGTSATVSMVADRYAECFSRAGFAVLLYDHRNFGRSEGEPRQEINPWIQCRGYRDAIDFIETVDAVDPGRIALWGDSYTGGEVIIVGAIDKRVKAIVAQCPVCGTEPPSLEPNRSNFEGIKETFLRGNVRGSPETTTGPVPVVSSDQAGTPSLLKPIQAFRWFIDYGGRHGSLWENRVIRVVPPTPVPFSAYLAAPYIKVPTFMMVGRNDEMVHCNPDVTQATYELLRCPKQWADIDGGHFGLLYYPSEIFAQASKQQCEFLVGALNG